MSKPYSTKGYRDHAVLDLRKCMQFNLLVRKAEWLDGVRK